MDAVLTVYVREGPAVVPEGIAAWTRMNGFAPATVNRHLSRIRAEGTWSARSRRPKGSRLATPETVRREVVRIRQELALVPGGDVGADVVRARLEQVAAGQGWTVPARSTIHKILVRAGLVQPAPTRRPKSSFRRFAYARPRDCYQMDGTDVSSIVGFPATVIEVIDDHSRVLVASHACVKETSAGACAALLQAFDDWGVPALVLADNGLAFSNRFATSGGPSRFTDMVATAGARLVHSSPYHPQTCGKCERHHQTFKKWLRAQPRPVDLGALQATVDTYRDWYNTTRWHSVCQGTPKARWDSSLDLGGPTQLPAQVDAHVLSVKVNSAGKISIRHRNIWIGRDRAGDHLTALLSGDHLTVYDTDGAVLGHLALRYDKRYLGPLKAA